MRQPSAADFVKSIESAPDPERDSALEQDFLAKMEAVFGAHPLWAGCSEEELDGADDLRIDEQLSENISLIQQFIRPENLDIKPTFQIETSWRLAQKELQKINMYKAPREKLVCILNCCKVVNNLLLNASIVSNEDPSRSR